jgi:hypothetical protein
VIKEQGVGSAAQAQPFVDKLVAAAGKANGWFATGASTRPPARPPRPYIHGATRTSGSCRSAPSSALRGKHQLEVMGKAEVTTAGGREYHIVSKTQADLAGCKGKPLASNHAR